MALRERNQAVVGIIGLILVAVAGSLAIGFTQLRSMLEDTEFRAELAESGGLRSGDDVRVSGVDVGTVKSVELVDDHVEVQFAAHDVTLGDKTTAFVKTDNALGRKFLAINPAGSGSGETIPLSRTDSGYAVTTALADLTTTTGKIDVKQAAQAMNSVSEVLDQTPAEFRVMIRGVSKLSRTISSRDAELRQLLEHTSNLSEVLAERNEEITSILSNGSLLFQELGQRRAVIHQLLDNVQRATTQLIGLTVDNKDSLGPALTELRDTARLLRRNRDTLDYALTNLGTFIRGLGEAVGTGPFFQTYLQNLTAPTTLAPILSDILDGA